MTQLTAYHQHNAQTALEPIEELARIQLLLGEYGIILERWPCHPLPANASQAQILETYAQEIAGLQQREGYASADVIVLTPEHPERTELRNKFLQEHTHSEDEVRFFISGSGAFYLPIGKLVFRVVCQAGDLLRVPANTPHWFDSGEHPDFTAIRIFTNPTGWVGHLTGNPLPATIPLYRHSIS